MELCPKDKCPHYHNATRYSRKCWHEPQCWRGMTDLFLFILKTRFTTTNSKSSVPRKKQIGPEPTQQLSPE